MGIPGALFVVGGGQKRSLRLLSALSDADAVTVAQREGLRFWGDPGVLGGQRKAAAAKAEELRQSVEKLQPFGIPVTASFGVAAMQTEKDDFSSMFDRVDQAVYQAKDAGRNQVVVTAR